MKKKILFTVCIASLLMIIATTVFASTLTLKLSADKTKFKKDDEITIEVNWEQEMQAADFSLNYNSKKLEFIESDIDETFINAEEDGKIKTVWVSMDDTNRTYIRYKFKVLETGRLKFTANVDGGFANGNLETPEKYVNAKLTIGSPSIVTILVVVVIIVLVIGLTYICIKNKKNKNDKS